MEPWKARLTQRQKKDGDIVEDHRDHCRTYGCVGREYKDQLCKKCYEAYKAELEDNSRYRGGRV